VLLLAERIVLLLHRMPPAPPRETERFELIGDSAAMAQLRADISAWRTSKSPSCCTARPARARSWLDR
jgi:hypothetical protein